MPKPYFMVERENVYDLHSDLPYRTCERVYPALRKGRERQADLLVWDVRRVGEKSWWDMLATGVYRYALGPPVGRGITDFKQVAEFYGRTHSYVRDGAIVHWDGDAQVLRQVPQRYEILVNTQGRWFGWDLAGRAVWLGPGRFVEQWRRYCELRACGVQVRGVLLDGIWPLVRRGLVVGGDLRPVMEPGPTKEMKYKVSARVLAQWWQAVGVKFDC